VSRSVLPKLILRKPRVSRTSAPSCCGKLSTVSNKSLRAIFRVICRKNLRGPASISYTPIAAYTLSSKRLVYFHRRTVQTSYRKCISPGKRVTSMARNTRRRRDIQPSKFFAYSSRQSRRHYANRRSFWPTISSTKVLFLIHVAKIKTE